MRLTFSAISITSTLVFDRDALLVGGGRGFMVSEVVNSAEAV
jgi:hypothetical protein